MATVQSRMDLLRHLADQRGFLRSSAAAFDRGLKAEAKRLAISIRVLVHDTRESTSLLAQLGLKDLLQYRDTADPLPEAVPGKQILRAPGFRLVSVGPYGYFAPLGSWAHRQHSKLPFDKWWTSELEKDLSGSAISRSALVLGLANKDGGAHVDPSLPAAYAAITRNNSLRHYINDAPGAGWILAAVRQIAFELVETLDDQLPLLLIGHEADAAAEDIASD